MYRKALSTQTKADWNEYNNQNLAELVSSVIDCIFQRPRSLERAILSPQQRLTLTLPHSRPSTCQSQVLQRAKELQLGQEKVDGIEVMTRWRSSRCCKWRIQILCVFFLAVSHAPTRKEWRVGGTKKNCHVSFRGVNLRRCFICRRFCFFSFTHNFPEPELKCGLSHLAIDLDHPGQYPLGIHGTGIFFLWIQRSIIHVVNIPFPWIVFPYGKDQVIALISVVNF